MLGSCIIKHDFYLIKRDKTLFSDPQNILKHCWKRRKYCCPAFCSFSHNIFAHWSQIPLFYNDEFLHPQKILTLSQMTNFRVFETERVCRQQFQSWWKWQKVFQRCRKHKEKENLLVLSNFCFSHSVFKRIVLQTHENQGLYGKGLILTGLKFYSIVRDINFLQYDRILDTCIKECIAHHRYKVVSPFPKQALVFMHL